MSATPVDEFTAASDPWVTPGLLRLGDRCEVIAKPGLGKSTLLQQWAARSAAGVHPLADMPVRPCRVLYVDVNTTEATLRRGLADALTPGLGAAHNLYVFSQGTGLYTDGDWKPLYDAVDRVKPELICIGPLFKLGSWSTPEKTAARLDKLRSGPGYWEDRPEPALLIEHHVADDGRRPADSELWRIWPDFGLRLHAAPWETGEGPDLAVSMFREARDGQPWPTALVRGAAGFRWVPEWETNDDRTQALASFRAAAESDR